MNIKLQKLLILFGTSIFAINGYTNPVVQNVHSGSAVVTQSGSTTTINQSSTRATIHWKKFNINLGEKTQFNQPDGGVTLNRIDASYGVSKIYGVLNANGQIILVNPAGIYFGPTAHVNVGGVIASTSDISDGNFASGNYVFDIPSTHSGSITNHGKIIAAQHGLVALLGHNVTNNGYIEAEMGSVVLASGNKFTLSFNGNQLVNFTVDEGTAQSGKVNNNGKISANGGKIIMTARSASQVLDNTINMNGVAEANTVLQQNGEIILAADNGRVRVTGNLIAQGDSATRGGNVKILGQKIDLVSAKISVSGETGGNIFVAGYETIPGTSINAKEINLAQCSLIAAQGLTTNGGNITFAADKVSISSSMLAQGDTGGGKINLYGEHIDLNNGAYVSTASNNGQGVVQLGSNPFADNVTDSINTHIHSVIDTSAYGLGKGGTVNFTANDIRLWGVVAANGNAQGSQGGTINVTGDVVKLNYFGRLLATGDTNGGRVTVKSPNLDSAIHLQPHTLIDVSANGVDATAGLITLGLANDLDLAGNLRAIGKGTNSFGGQVQIAGKNITLQPTAVIDANGDILGGRIVIGTNPLISTTPVADLITVKSHATINAKATGATGLGGGTITIFAKDTVFNGRAATNAQADGGTGGRVNLLATNKVQVGAGSKVEAIGDLQGGQILVGGPLNGDGIEPNAMFTTIERNSILNASALKNGNGGNVIVWADDTTDFAGHIKATGGSASGDGGFVQMVGVQQLINDGTIDVSAPNGNPGTVDTTP